MATATQASSTLSESLVERISENLNEPEFMKKLRKQAFQQYEELPVPSAANSEEWRRTDVTDLEFDQLLAGDGTNEPPDRLHENFHRIKEAETDRAGLHFEVNTAEAHCELDDQLVEQGVVLTSMSTAVREYPDLVEEHFMEAMDADTNKFSALHAAFWTGGTFLYVPRDLEIDRPIEIHNYVDRDGLSILDHTLIIVGTNSRVNIVETHDGDPEMKTRSLSASAVEIHAADGARVDYSHIQDLPLNFYDVSMRRGICRNAASINWITGTLGGSKVKTGAITKLLGEGSETYLYGVMLADGEQHIDSDISTIHDAPYTTDEMLARGVVLDDSKGIFRGVIEMKNGSRKSKGSLHERCLMVGEDAEADAVPEMEIDENDVKAAHSASVGEIDAKQMLYMTSRGISREQARRLIIFGFFEPILERLPVERVKQDLVNMIARKLDHARESLPDA